MLSRMVAVRCLLFAGLGLAPTGCVLLPAAFCLDEKPTPGGDAPAGRVREYQTMAAPEIPPPADPLRQLYQRAADRYVGIDSYIVRLRRREQVGGQDKPEETLLVKFRKVPWSVYFKWLGKEGQGREAVYVQGQYENKIHTLLAAGDMPLVPAGKQLALPPDSVLVRGRSRHDIKEAGVGALVERFGQAVAYRDRNGKGMLRYLGPQKRPESETPLEAVEQTIPAGAEEALPQGGRRCWYFDPVGGLPTLVVTQDKTDHEVEYYCYDRLETPVNLDDDDFNPEKLWKKK